MAGATSPATIVLMRDELVWCPGSGRAAVIERTTFRVEAAASEWIGACPECGRQLELGYAGLVPRHAAPDEERGIVG